MFFQTKDLRVNDQTARWATVASAVLALIGILLMVGFRKEDQRTAPKRDAQLAEAIADAADRHAEVPVTARGPRAGLLLAAPAQSRPVPARSDAELPEPAVARLRTTTAATRGEPADAPRFTESPSPSMDDPVRSSDRVNMLAFTETPTS